jgi:CheY-like chemotaxis protein
LKLEAKGLTPTLAPTQLDDVIQSVATVARPQMPLGVEFVVSVSEVDRTKRIVCDPLLLNHVLINLCQNAARFTAAGSVTLAAAITEGAGTGTDEQQVRFAVRDTGKGISAETKRTLFSRYRSDGGIGIGLYLSSQLVVAMGSRIEVASPSEESGAPGSSFSFAIPFKASVTTTATAVAEVVANVEEGGGRMIKVHARPRDSPRSVTDTQPSGALPSAQGADPQHQMRPTPHTMSVLLADDDFMSRRLLIMVFERFGWEVTASDTAEMALKRIMRGEKYDLLVIDEYFLPTHSMLGSTAIRHLRRHFAGRESELPFVLSCTGGVDEHMMSHKKEELLSAGADAAWTKPFPDWRDGTMQRELSREFTLRGRPFSIASNVSKPGVFAFSKGAGDSEAQEACARACMRMHSGTRVRVRARCACAYARVCVRVDCACWETTQVPRE